ncbi:MAG: hypothetical protein U9P63_01870 [Patescibacteria group bacterium]|nr:hypothetical protein [Patescibacteria group bacterium]
MILILGNSNDLAETVVEEIRKTSKHKIAFFKSNKCLEEKTIGFSCINNSWSLFADIDGNEIDISKADAVWYWKLLLPRDLRIAEQSEFIHRQFLTLWLSIVSILRDKKWVNQYNNAIEADRKPYQLKIASEIGFNIPDTLITSSPRRTKDFWQYCKKEIIIKPLRIVPREDRVIFTNILSEEKMEQIERLKFSPAILQKKIESKYELRITVVGNKIFPAKIKRKSEIDWRRDEINAEATKLPKNIQDKCFELTQRLGLGYGCIDMAITPDKKYIFFEINPNGQWKFIENKTKMPIGQAIAHLLI